LQARHVPQHFEFDESIGGYHHDFKALEPDFFALLIDTEQGLCWLIIENRFRPLDAAGYQDGLNLYNAYFDVNGRDPLGDTATNEDKVKILKGQTLTSCAPCHKGQNSNQLMPDFSALGQLEPQYTEDQLLQMHFASVYMNASMIPQGGYFDMFGWHKTFCMSCHDQNNPNSMWKMRVAQATLSKSWAFFWLENSPALLPAVGSLGKKAISVARKGATKSQEIALYLQMRTSALRNVDDVVQAPSALVQSVNKNLNHQLISRVPKLKGPVQAPPVEYGVRFFGKEQVKYYTGDNAILGRADSYVFFSPVEDMAVVKNARDAARYTGMAPSALNAYKNSGDIYGIAFPTKGLDMKLPTLKDAGGWEHFLDGGNTAVLLPNSGGYILNPVREFVTKGTSVPKGAVLFKMGSNGEWIILRKF